MVQLENTPVSFPSPCLTALALGSERIAFKISLNCSNNCSIIARYNSVILTDSQVVSCGKHLVPLIHLWKAINKCKYKVIFHFITRPQCTQPGTE